MRCDFALYTQLSFQVVQCPGSNRYKPKTGSLSGTLLKTSHGRKTSPQMARRTFALHNHPLHSLETQQIRFPHPPSTNPVLLNEDLPSSLHNLPSRLLEILPHSDEPSEPVQSQKQVHVPTSHLQGILPIHWRPRAVFVVESSG